MTPDSRAFAPETRRNDVDSMSVQPLRALRALVRLSANPDDTAEVFTIIEALSGRSPLRTLARFRADPLGRQLLDERPQLLRMLADRPLLENMPRGSLARAYLDFLDSEGITAEGLVQASVDGRKGQLDPESDLSFFTERIRDAHDLWHTVTGWQGDVVGETSLLAFNVAQLHNPGVATIVAAALVQYRDVEFYRLVARGFMDGLRAQWLAVAHWEKLLPLPLSYVRAQLRVTPVPAYTPMRTRDLRDLNLLPRASLAA
jgi:ubiquinone biosynthesis protein COQ4